MVVILGILEVAGPALEQGTLEKNGLALTTLNATMTMIPPSRISFSPGPRVVVINAMEGTDVRH